MDDPFQLELFDPTVGMGQTKITDFVVKHQEEIMQVALPKNGKPRASPYTGSAFESVSKLSMTKKGKWGEEVVRRLAVDMRFRIEKADTNHGDWCINNLYTEVKTATVKTNGTYQFNQVRPDQDYDYLQLVCVAPHRIWLFTIPKFVAIPCCRRQEMGLYLAMSLPNLINRFGAYDDIAGFEKAFMNGHRT